MFVPSMELLVNSTTPMKRIVDLPWLWIVLLELHLMRCNWFPLLIEDQESCARRALIN
jgi:hypothetical protein